MVFAASKATVANVFKKQLAQLMKQLNETQCSYVRCIKVNFLFFIVWLEIRNEICFFSKPNSEKAASMFDDQLVTDQLRYTGMLETIRIRKLGYGELKKKTLRLQFFKKTLFEIKKVEDFCMMNFGVDLDCWLTKNNLKNLKPLMMV